VGAAMPAEVPITVPAVLALLLFTGTAVLVLVIWSIRSHRNPKLAVECDAPLDELLPSLSGLTQGVLYTGNRVELLVDTAFFDALFDEIGKAQRSVHFETFLWKEGRLGQRLVDALIARAAAGVRVRVMLDANGTKKMGDAARQQLIDAGCKICRHHPGHLRHIGVFNDRDHRKLAVLDGRVAFVGGHCITDAWLCDGDERARDLGVRITGPAVHGVQSVFAENWVEDTGELFVGDDVFPPLAPAGDASVHVASLKPEGSPPAVKLLHHLAVCLARQRLWIQNPYFLPDAEAVDALCQAVARGVDVRVMVPSAVASDMSIVQHAAHRNFERLLAGGVRIYEYQSCLLHQKAMSVDGSWCAIGSSNFDDRSFETNDEITLGVHDAALAHRLEEAFEHDARDCIELELETWRRRGLWHRLKDKVLYAFNELL
jgi:cardiolipin synthase